jgi:hypothetical protein
VHVVKNLFKQTTAVLYWKGAQESQAV